MSEGESIRPNMAESEPRKTTRRRLQLACAPCKASKVKCDRSLPVCQQCYKRSRESSCKYTEKGIRYNSSTQTVGHMKEKMQRLEVLFSSLVPQSQDEQTKASQSPGDWKIEPNMSEMSANLGKLKLTTSGGTQWIGPSNWESVIEDIEDIKAYFEQGEIEEASIGGMPNDEISNANIFFATPHMFTQTDLIDLMPHRREMDQSIASWFNLMDPTRVIVHAPTFQQKYEQFWNNPTTPPPGWFALLLATCSLGAEVSGQALSCGATLTRAELLRRLTSHALVLANPTKPQPWLIECLILYIVGLLYNQHDVSSYIWQCMGLTMRLCHQAGLHRDPGRNPKFSQFASEMRRRVWMVACELDTSISNTIGMVGAVNPSLCDTLPPSNLTEEDLSPENCAIPRSHEECTLIQVEICFAKLVQILGDVVVSSQTVVPPTIPEVEHLSKRLAKTRRQLPEKLKAKPLEQSYIDSPTEIVDRLRLEFAYQKAVCILYRRFLTDPNYERERQKCMDAAQTIVRNTIAMLRAAQPGGQLAAFRILLMRHVHDFTLAAMLICSQLKGFSAPTSSPENELLGDSARPTILEACQLWYSCGLKSPKERIALNTIEIYLQGYSSNNYPSNTPATEKDLRLGGTSIAEHTSQASYDQISVGILQKPSQDLAGNRHVARGGILNFVFDQTGSSFSDVQTDWSCTPSEEYQDYPIDRVDLWWNV